MTKKIQLGSESLYPDHYDPDLLAPIPRRESRSQKFYVGESNALLFRGVDVWTAFELSWLDALGKPRVAIAEFAFAHDSQAIIESKSFKYYLNSLNHSRFDSEAEVKEVLARDLLQASGSPVEVTLCSVEQGAVSGAIPGMCVDDIEVEIANYSPLPSLLETSGTAVKRQQLYSHLLKSNCPVTGQPDWATLWIEYSGREISPASFLKYIVSYRGHQDFHENCVEQIFFDIANECQTDELSVYGRYTRRGGLDINPFRSDFTSTLPFSRLCRQ